MTFVRPLFRMLQKNVPRAVASLLDEAMRTEVSKDSVWCPIAAGSWEKILQIALDYNSSRGEQIKPSFDARDGKLSRCRGEAASDCEMGGQGVAGWWNGPIDNRSLCEPHGDTMSRELSPASYELVPERVFNELVDLFGILPASAKSCPSFRCRTRLGHDGRYEIEVSLTPLSYYWGYNSKEMKRDMFSRFDNLSQIYSQIADRLIANPLDGLYPARPLPLSSHVKVYQLLNANNSWIQLSKEEPLYILGLPPHSTICFDLDDSLQKSTRSETERAGRAQQGRRLNSSTDERYSSSSPAKEGDHAAVPVRGLRGLLNLGNTCFMNSSIQCLSNVPDLREYFESGAYRADMEAGSRLPASNTFRPHTRGAVASAFSNLLKEMWSPGAGPCDPSELRRAITRISNKFSGYSQQDSQELMGVLLDALHEDVKTPWSDVEVRNELEANSAHVGKQPANLIRQRLEQMSQDIACTDDEISRLALCLHRCQGESHVMQLLRGMVKSTVQCLNCYQYSRTFDPFIFLCLPISEDVQYNGFSPAKRANFRVSTPVQKKLDICNNTEAVFCPLVTLNGTIRIAVAFLSRSMINADSDKYSSESETKVNVLLKAAEECCAFVDTGGVHPVPRLYMVHLKRGQDVFSIVAPDEPLAPMLRKRNEVINCDPKGGEYVLCSGYFLCQSPPTAFSDRDPALVTIALGRYPLFPLFISHAGLKRSIDSPKGGRPATSILLLANQTLKNAGFDAQLIQSSIEPAGSRGDHDDALRTYLVRCNLQENHWRERPYKNERAQVDKKHFRKQFREILSDRLENAKLPHLADFDHGVTLSQCFSLFTETELLDEEDMWYCSECKKKSVSTKKMDIFELPPYLLIQLKRFRQIFYGRQKIDTPVKFPVDELDLSNFLPKGTRSKCTYELVAISNHYGSLHGGHYTAFARNCIDNNWYVFDDSQVTKIRDRGQLMSSDAYILVYKRSGCAL